MSTQVKLKAQKREDTGKGNARKMRASGRVPAIVYGKDADTISLSLDANEATHLFQSISVENTLVDLTVEGEKGEIMTLVREIQVHPWRNELLHVDFYRVQKGVKLEVEIPVHLNGMPEGVKHSGGVLQQVIHELPVLVLPSKIPESFEVDVTGLDVGDSIHVSDLQLDADVEHLFEPDRTIATVVVPRAALVDEEEEAEAAEIELIGAEAEGAEGEAEAEETEGAEE